MTPKFRVGDTITPNSKHPSFKPDLKYKLVVFGVDTNSYYRLLVVESSRGMVDEGYIFNGRCADDIDSKFDIVDTSEEEII
jgi:hypothetical protein